MVWEISEESYRNWITLKNLGVNVLWISPMLESPQDDNGYDISDYRRIYEEYGTMEDYEELLCEAHKKIHQDSDGSRSQPYFR